MLEPGSASFARYSDLVRESFSSLRTAEGRRLVENLYFSAEQFPGKRMHHLPDLIVAWSGLEPASRLDSTLGTLSAELDTGRGGNHLASGFQIVLQPGVKQAGEDRPLPITELAPMILRSFEAGPPGN